HRVRQHPERRQPHPLGVPRSRGRLGRGRARHPPRHAARDARPGLMGGSIAQARTEGREARGGAPYGDLAPRSPWISQLAPDGPARPLEADATADVAIVGAGIAGVATAFFTLRATDRSVLLIERDRVARGATGRNAGQLTTYFERPLASIAAQFGVALAVEAQRTFDDAHDLMDEIAAEAGTTVRVER